MKTVLGSILAFILLASMFTQGIQAEGGNAVWLTKTKRGIDISCPTGYIYEEKLSYNCVKRGDTSFLVSLTYDDLVIEKEFFNEKDIMKQAILVVKLAGDTKILEKKSSWWFYKITAEIKYEINGIKGFQRMIVFNDGTVITMNFLTNSKIGEADKILSNHVKILDPNQVKEIEKKNAQYAKQAQEKANLKQAEEKKKAAEKKAADSKKAIVDAKIKVIDNKLKVKARENIALWKERAEQLNNGFLSANVKKYYSTTTHNALYNGFLQSIKNYESDINNLKNTSKDKVDQVMNNHNKTLSKKYDAVNSSLQNLENPITECKTKEANRGNYSYEYEQAYGKNSSTIEYDVKTHFFQNQFSGTLKDKNGSPISNAGIFLYTGIRSNTLTASTNTDSDGNWKIDIPEKGFWIIKISKSGFTDKKFEIGYEYDHNYRTIKGSCTMTAIN